MITNKEIFKHFAIRYDMKNKLEFYGRLREMIREARDREYQQWIERIVIQSEQRRN